MMNKYMLVIFPICYDNWEYIDNLIEKQLIIIEKKEVKLSEDKKFELIYELYKGEKWLGNVDNNWEGVYYKMNSCFTNKISKVIFYYVLSNDITTKNIKEKIRNFCKCGKHSIHSTDYEEKA